MDYQMTFKRYELKYLLNQKEKECILKGMKDYMKLDSYGRTTIRNISKLRIWEACLNLHMI